MTARRVRSTLVVVAAVALMAIALMAQSSKARIVRLSYIDGDARIENPGSKGEQKAILNMPVVEGTRLAAQDGSRVEVEFENGSTLRLVGPAEVIFRELSMKGDGEKVTLVDVQNGLVYFDIDKQGNDDFRLALGDHNLGVKKSARFRADGNDKKVAVFKGELELLGAPKDVAVKKDETISFDGTDQAKYELAKGYDPLGADIWDHDREQDRETFARSQQYKSALSYSGSPYNYGMYDMASYGSWFAGPGGACWRPAGYGMGWDPFSYGAWNYYPTNGWVFISPYAWGWTPYRYGAWNWYDTTGWCWNPGGYMGWNPYPVMYIVPQQYQPPTPPNKPGGPPVFIGGRKVLPGAPADPNAFRKPAKGMDPDSFRKPSLDAAGKAGGMPTAKRLTPVPTGRAWGSGGAMPHGAREPMPSMRPSSPSSAPHEATPRPSMPRPSAPAPRYEPAPRMAPMAPPPPPPPAAPAPSAHPH